MARQLLMGVDIGTQSSRVAFIDQRGYVVASASTEQELITPRPGWAEQDPEMWWQNTLQNIRKAMASGDVSGEEVVAIGVAGQMHATVPISTTGELLSHGVLLWCDKRSADLVDRMKAHSDCEIAMRLAANPPVPSWLGFHIQWVKVHQPDIYAKTWKFLPSKDYITYRLTSAVATDYSEASGSFLMDARTKSWSPQLADYLEIDVNKLPDLRPAHEVIGTVTPEAASVTGLLAGTPVVVGAGDMMCMLISSGLSASGRASDITGTASIMAVYVDEPVEDYRLMNLHHAMPGWVPFGIIDSGGGSLSWFVDSICYAQVEEARRTGQNIHAILNPLATAVEPGCEGLLFFPYLLGERSLGTPHARGNFFGITPRTGIGAMVRAIMEGVTFELRRPLEIVEASGNTITEVYTIGGGANSDLWSQIKADIYQKPVHTFRESEGGILGASILAGVGVGIYPDVQTGAAQTQRLDKTFQPNPELAERYHALYELFKDVHDRLQQPFDRLALIP
ncbi:MAG: hypothetical protein F9K27_02760 [Anaerolineae bacterium]|nr:MAG: hypothetical protein F9K27_02760 [Anaerolineae bacterium]